MHRLYTDKKNITEVRNCLKTSTLITESYRHLHENINIIGYKIRYSTIHKESTYMKETHTHKADQNHKKNTDFSTNQ